MGRIFCLMGKSSSGKDTVYKSLTEDSALCLKPIVPYTTRPIRQGEKDGREYHFVTEEQLLLLQKAGRVVELRTYDTIQGIWKYFTVCEEQMDLEKESYVVIGTLDSWRDMCVYFGSARMVPVYLEVEDGVRLERALLRERAQASPDYEELCRRYLADQADFSDENLEKAGIRRRFQNDKMEKCLQDIKLFIWEEMRYNDTYGK